MLFSVMGVFNFEQFDCGQTDEDVLRRVFT